MDQTLTGTVHGNAIVFDNAAGLPEGTRVEVSIRAVTNASNDVAHDAGKPAWWTDEDDRILQEIYQARKIRTRREIEE